MLQLQVTIVDRDERDEQNLITRRMQRSECRSGTTNTPTMAENQLSESQPESHVEVSMAILSVHRQKIIHRQFRVDESIVSAGRGTLQSPTAQIESAFRLDEKRFFLPSGSGVARVGPMALQQAPPQTWVRLQKAPVSSMVPLCGVLGLTSELLVGSPLSPPEYRLAAHRHWLAGVARLQPPHGLNPRCAAAIRPRRNLSPGGAVLASVSRRGPRRHASSAETLELHLAR